MPVEIPSEQVDTYYCAARSNIEKASAELRALKIREADLQLQVNWNMIVLDTLQSQHPIKFELAERNYESDI